MAKEQRMGMAQDSNAAPGRKRRLRLPTLSPFLRDIVLTQATAVATIIGLLFATRLLARGFGGEDFGVYSIGRRVFTALEPFATLSMGVAISRHVALATDAADRFRFFWAGLIIVVVPVSVVFCVGAALSPLLSTVLTGRADLWLVIVAALYLTAGHSIYTVLYALYRGRAWMGRANLWQLGCVVTGPILIAACCARPGAVPTVLFLMGTCFFMSLVALGAYALKGWSLIPDRKSLWLTMRQLLQYGVPRVPGYFAHAGLLAVGPFLAPRFAATRAEGLRQAGQLALGEAILTMMASTLSSFGMVALPKVAQLLAQKHDEFIRASVGNLFSFAFHGSLFAMLHLALWSDAIVRVWLGAGHEAVAPMVCVFALAIPPYASYVLLRSVIDALEVRAVNTRNLLFGLSTAIVLAVVLASAGMGAVGIALGTVAGFLVLGLSSAWYLQRRLHIPLGQLRAGWCVGLNVACISAAWLVKSTLGQERGGFVQIIGIVLVELSLACLYYLALRRLKVQWVSEFERRFLWGRAKTAPHREDR